jgi:hypothetical protein
MDVWCVYVFILGLCCPVFRQRPCDGLITRPRSPIISEKWLRNWIRGLGSEWAGRTIENKFSFRLISQRMQWPLPWHIRKVIRKRDAINVLII